MVPVSVAIGGMSGCVLPGRIIGVQELQEFGSSEARYRRCQVGLVLRFT